MARAGRGSRALGRRGAGQDKLQEAISAQASREQTAAYSEDFESDEDDMLNGVGEELNESNSSAESTKKSVAVQSPVSDGGASQKAADLESKAADDFTLSCHEKKLQQIMLLESENIEEDREDGEEECLESYNEGDDRKNNEECSAEVPRGNSDTDAYDLPMGELQKRRREEENKPVPKPRMHKTRNASASESENIEEDREDGEEECLESYNEGDDRKNNEECSAEVPRGNSDTDAYDLPMGELQKRRREEENKPVPKPRMHKTRNASASAKNISIPSLDSSYKPSPQPRCMLRKSAPVEDNEINRSEGKMTSRSGFSSFSKQSSLTTGNVQATPKKKLLAESPGPEGPWLETTSPPFSVNFTSRNERFGASSLLICGEALRVKDQDQKKISTSDMKLEDNSSRSSSVTEVTMTTVYEKTKTSEKSTDDSSDEIGKTVEGQIVTDTVQEVSVNDQPEHGDAKNTSKDSVKKLSETKERALQNLKASLSDRSLSSAHLKKKAKAVPSAAPVSSQYLGTPKVLENKRVQKNSTEFDKADGLRAAVFQNWLEKKILLLELKRLDKKAENLKNNTEKKEAVKREEAIASFEAWKKKKSREAEKLNEQMKLEELAKKTAAEQNEEKKEAAHKAFEKWKERKAEYLREQSRKEKEYERIRKKKEEELVAEKKKDSMSAVAKWNEKKQEYIKQKKGEKILEGRRQEMQQAKKEEKNKKAVEEYERWLDQPSLKGRLATAQNLQSQAASPAATEKKERREQLEKKQKKLRAVHGNVVPSPWNPPGKVTYSRHY